MDESKWHEVDFTLCLSCKHKNLTEHEEPCCDCLAIPARMDSRRPEYWEEMKSEERR